MGVAVPFVHGPEGVDVYDGSTTYNAPGISATRGGWVGSNLRYVMPCGGTWKHHLVKVYPAPAAGKSYGFYLSKGGSSYLTVSLFNPSTSGSNLSGELDVAAGDVFYYGMTGSAGSGNSIQQHSLLFEPSVAGTIPFLLAAAGGPTIDYWGLGGHFASGASYEARVHCVVPIPGKFKSLYLYSCDGNVASDVAVCLRKNGANTALTATIPNGAAAASNLVSEVSFAAGDMGTLSVNCTTYEYVAIGLCFVPDDPKQWWMPCAKGRVALGNAKYNWINGGLCHQTGTPWLSAEYSAGSYDCRIPWPSGPVIKGIALGLTNAPGAGNSRTVTLLKNSASSGLSVTVSGTSAFGTGTGEVAPADFDLLSLYATTSGSPASSTGSIALFGEVQTPVVGGADIVVPRFAPAVFV